MARSGATRATGTVYKRGQIAVNSSGNIVAATVDHNAAASYATDTAEWDPVTVPTLALAPSNGRVRSARASWCCPPEDFGAVGDWYGSTDADDTGAFTRMFAELAATSVKSGAYIQLTKGKNYRVNGLTQFVGLKIVGGGELATTMTFTVLDVFSLSGTLYNMVFEDVQFYGESADGHLFAGHKHGRVGSQVQRLPLHSGESR